MIVIRAVTDKLSWLLFFKKLLLRFHRSNNALASTFENFDWYRTLFCCHLFTFDRVCLGSRCVRSVGAIRCLFHNFLSLIFAFHRPGTLDRCCSQNLLRMLLFESSFKIARDSCKDSLKEFLCVKSFLTRANSLWPRWHFVVEFIGAFIKTAFRYSHTDSLLLWRPSISHRWLFGQLSGW